MTRLSLAQCKVGTVLFLVAAAGCRNSNAASSETAKPPPPPVPYDVASSPIPPDPGIREHDAERAEQLLKSIKSTTLLEPDRGGESEAQARIAFAKTFSPDYLPTKLRSKIQISQTKCEKFGCRIEITYPDWTTFVELDRAVLYSRTDHGPSPFIAFPGAHYRTARVKKGDKAIANWILAYRIREPNEGHGSYGKDVP
jgi:hypothetical protein